MALRTITGHIGSSKLRPVTVFVYDIDLDRSWYVQEGGTCVNLTDTGYLLDGVVLDIIPDHNCFTWDEINSEEELEIAVET